MFLFLAQVEDGGKGESDRAKELLQKVITSPPSPLSLVAGRDISQT